MGENKAKRIEECEKFSREYQRWAENLAASGDMEGYRRWSEKAAFLRNMAYCLKNGLTA